MYPHLLRQHGGEGVERLGEGQDDGAVEEGQELWRSASNFGEDDDQDPGFVDGDYDLFHDVDVKVERGGALMVDVQPWRRFLRAGGGSMWGRWTGSEPSTILRPLESGGYNFGELFQGSVAS